MNDTTFQGDGELAYVPVVVNAKLTKPSNADRIRAMTDEELAEFIQKSGYGSCPNVPQCPQYESGDKPYTEDGCRKCWLDWLRQEAI